MSLLVVGSVAFDALETPSGKRDQVLGGAASYFSLAASVLTDIQLVGVVGDDFTDFYLKKFAGRPIDLGGLVKHPGKTFVWKGRYGTNMNEAETLDTQLGVFGDFDPVLPPHFRHADYLFLANILPRLQSRVLDLMAKRPHWVGLDTMNLWINTAREDLLAVLKRVDILLINNKELELLIQDPHLSIAESYPRVVAMGPKIVVVKKGNQGAELFCPMGSVHMDVHPVGQVVDPTGAGDSFAAGFLGYLAQSRSSLQDFSALKTALMYANAMASFTVENFGPESLETLKHDQLLARVRFYQA
jgi:sugar/nucleoside kinase (ribokinase family)